MCNSVGTSTDIALLGAPSATAPWLIQFGGHHLAINVTVVGANNVLTPSLPAAQPARYMLNGQTIRPLGDENDKAFALIGALDAAQQKQAILNYRVSDLVLGPGEDGKTIQPEGILASALTASQQTMLLDIAHEWVGILNDEAAAAEDGGIEGQPVEDLLRLERRHEEWRARVLPHPGPDGGHRVRSATGRSRSHPYDLSGSHQRLRREARRAMSTRHLVWSCVVIGWLWAAAPAGAHRLDEYLQATRIGVTQNRIDLEIDLTAGASIAQQIFALVDANGDGQINDAEGDEYARQVIDAIRLSVDSRRLSVTLVSRTFPDRQAMGLGLGTIRLRATAPASAGTGRHDIVYVNTHAPASSVYLVNALLPSDARIQISTQQRDVEQRGVTVDYRVVPSEGWVRGGWLVTVAAMFGVLLRRRGGRFQSAQQ